MLTFVKFCNKISPNVVNGVELMAVEIVKFRCPTCGAPLALDSRECEYCGSPVVIRTVNNLFESLPTVSEKNDAGQLADPDIASALRFLKAKLYDRALKALESAISNDFNNSDTYFYAAIASLKGKRPFLVSSAAVKKAEEYLQTAIAIEPKGIYYYLWAYIRLDHHFKKFYKASPDYKELFGMANNAGLSQADVQDLFNILGGERPSEL